MINSSSRLSARRFAPTPPRRVSSAPALPVEEAFRGLLQRRKYLIVCFLLSLLASLVAMFALQKNKHAYQGALLYTPNNITAPYYSPPSLNNLVQIVDSPILLEKLRSQSDLDESLSDLKRNVKFELVPGGDTLAVSVVRHDPDEAASLLNDAMRLFVLEASKIRKQALEGFVKEFESDLVLGKKGHSLAMAQLQKWLDTNRLESSESVKSAASASQRAVAELDMELEMARIELASARAKRERLVSARANRARRSVNDENSAENQDDFPLSDALLMTNDSDRRVFLRDQISQEQQSSAYAVKLQVKDREYQRAKALHDRGLISDSEMDRIKGERSILRAEQNTRVEQLQKQLVMINRKMSDNFSSSVTLAMGGPLLLSEEPRLLRQSIALLELEILGAENKVERLALKLDSKQTELGQVSRAQKEIEPLLEEVRLASAERDRLQRLAEEFRQAHRSQVDDLKVVKTATPVIDGVRSNAAKVFAATLLGTLGLLVGPIFFREWQKQTGSSAASVARTLGLPLLADFRHRRGNGDRGNGDRGNGDRGNEGQETEELASLLALRIRRELPEDNVAILFTGSRRCEQQLSAPLAVAQAVARRGDSVVLVNLVDEEIPSLAAESEFVSAQKTDPVAAVADTQFADKRAGKAARNAGPRNGTARAKNGKSANWNEETQLGVSDFLQGEAFDVGQLIRPSQHPNLGSISSGTKALTGNLLTNGKLGELFDQLKSDHAMVLIAGPRLDQRLQLECLLSSVEGVVVSCQGEPLDENARTTVHELLEAEVPVLGVVT